MDVVPEGGLDPLFKADQGGAKGGLMACGGEMETLQAALEVIYLTSVEESAENQIQL